MAVLKQRLHRKNSSGTYDTVHLETSASVVIMNDGTTAEASIGNRCIVYIQNTAPVGNKKHLWVDTGNSGIIKYYNGSAWVPTHAAWA